MKRNIFTLAVLFIAGMAFAQSSNQSRAILDKAFNAYEKSRGILLDFNITTSEANGTAYQPQTGKARIKGNKFKLEMDAMDTWYDGKTQWVLMKDANEVNISNPTSTEIASLSPLALLGMYKTGFTLKNPVSKMVNGKSAFVIDMIPDGKSDFKQLSVAIDKKTHAVLQVKTLMSNDTKSTIDISSYNPYNYFSEAVFVFNKAAHPGVEIVDLR